MALYPLLAAVPSLLSLVFFVVGAIVVTTRRDRIGRKPANLALAGLGLLLLDSLMVVVLPSLVVRAYGISGGGFPSVFAGIGIVAAVVHLGGILLLLLAVIADRQPAAPAWPAWAAPPAAAADGPIPPPASGPQF